MHSLSTSFVLGYHGCTQEIGERLLRNEPFLPSTNEYDWLGAGIYFWEANPDRALAWAHQVIERDERLKGPASEPFVVGAVIDSGFCLDLISSNGIAAVESAFERFRTLAAEYDVSLPRNKGGADWLLRELDCAVINYLHTLRDQAGQPPFDSVRGVFMEGEHIYANSGFRRKTHIQLCVRNPQVIKGIFRVPESHFSGA